MSLKKHPPQSSSLSSFTAQTQNSQITKKSIATQQISLQSSHSHHTKSSSISLSTSASTSSSNLYNSNRHHNIVLPFEINIQSLIKHLLIKLQENGISVLYKDQDQGQILVQRVGKKGCFDGLLDCFCICRKEGWPKRGITKSFQAVSILVKRQYIQSRSRIKVSPNCPQQKSSPQLRTFLQQLIQIIKKCSQNFKQSQQQNKLAQISDQSPLLMQIKAKQKAYQLFIGQQYEDKRYRTLFNTSLTKLKSEIKSYKKQLEYLQSEQKMKQGEKGNSEELNSLQGKSKKAKKSMTIATIIDLLVNETNNIFQFCRQLNIVNAPQFHPDYALYAIEGLLCYNVFPEIFQLYKNQLKAHCQKFHENSEIINKNLSQKQYFDYLQIRPKFRLQTSLQPYSLAINALRELQTSLTLRQLLLCMQKTFSLIKVCCLYEHDGKLDITSMDDILPVMIFVVAKAQVTDFPVYVKIIDDYVRIKGVFQLEQRVITTLYVATEDISKKLSKVEKN